MIIEENVSLDLILSGNWPIEQSWRAFKSAGKYMLGTEIQVALQELQAGQLALQWR